MKKLWSCKIGEVDVGALSEGADAPMRQAVQKAYLEVTGDEADFVFSGWGDQLTEPERAVVENREPSAEHEARWHAGKRYLKAIQDGSTFDGEALRAGISLLEGALAGSTPMTVTHITVELNCFAPSGTTVAAHTSKPEQELGILLYMVKEDGSCEYVDHDFFAVQHA